MQIRDDWRRVLTRAYSLRVQFGQLLFGLLTWLDPATALGVWNMMPDVVVARVPAAFVAGVGGLLFVLALLTIVLRLTVQTKLQPKDKTDGVD